MKAAIILLICAVTAAYSSQEYGSPDNRYRTRLPLTDYHRGPQGYRPAGSSYQAPPPQYGQSQGYDNGRAYGRRMEYTVNGPNERGKMKVTETHVQMDRRMNGQEAEQAMKQIMGSMQDSKSNFKDFVKDIGFHDFARI